MDRSTEALAGLAILALVSTTCLVGCGGEKETAAKGDEERNTSELRKYESDFHPSDFDPEPGGTVAGPGIPASPTLPGVPDQTTPASSESVPGYRVQVFSSTNIDAANTEKTKAETLFPSEWFYLEYDPPTYKIRAGNFLSRFEAEQFLKQLTEKGYENAWVVPEHVYKQPPPPSQQPEPPQQ